MTPGNIRKEVEKWNKEGKRIKKKKSFQACYHREYPTRAEALCRPGNQPKTHVSDLDSPHLRSKVSRGVYLTAPNSHWLRAALGVETPQHFDQFPEQTGLRTRESPRVLRAGSPAGKSRKVHTGNMGRHWTTCLLTSCVTLEKLLTFSYPSFHSPEMEIKMSFS